MTNFIIKDTKWLIFINVIRGPRPRLTRIVQLKKEIGQWIMRVLLFDVFNGCSLLKKYISKRMSNIYTIETNWRENLSQK